jgi:hypothetical protein
MRKTKSAPRDEEVIKARELILTCKGGKLRKMTIPGDWTFTYGALVPPAKNDPHSGARFVPSLRLYGPGGKTDLRAVMTDVSDIRDASIPILERQTNVQRKVQTKHTPQGAKDVIVEARVTEWVDPDGEDGAQANEFLPHFKKNDEEDF